MKTGQHQHSDEEIQHGRLRGLHRLSCSNTRLYCWSDSLFKSAFLHVTLEHRAVSFSAVVTGSVCPNIQTAPYPAFAYFSLPGERPKGEKAPGENDPVQKMGRIQLGSGSLDSVDLKKTKTKHAAAALRHVVTFTVLQQ